MWVFCNILWTKTKTLYWIRYLLFIHSLHQKSSATKSWFNWLPSYRKCYCLIISTIFIRTSCSKNSFRWLWKQIFLYKNLIKKSFDFWCSCSFNFWCFKPRPYVSITYFCDLLRKFILSDNFLFAPMTLDNFFFVQTVEFDINRL